MGCIWKTGHSLPAPCFTLPGTVWTNWHSLYPHRADRKLFSFLKVWHTLMFHQKGYLCSRMFGKYWVEAKSFTTGLLRAFSMLIHAVNFQGKLGGPDLFDYKTLLHFLQWMLHGTHWKESPFSSLFKWEDEVICQDHPLPCFPVAFPLSWEMILKLIFPSS